jgi:twitching motility protein PilJ
VLLVATSYFVWQNYRTSTYGAQYIADAGQLRMLSQRLGKASLQGLLGNPEAFKQVRSSRDAFAEILQRLQNGGTVRGVAVPPSPESTRPALQTLVQQWQGTQRNAGTLLQDQANLIGLGKAVARVNESNPKLLDLAEQVQTRELRSGASTREISASGELVMLTQRLAKNANALLAGETIDPEVAFLLGKDTNVFRATLEGLRKGSAVLRLPAGRAGAGVPGLPRSGGLDPREHAAPDSGKARGTRDLRRLRKAARVQ